MRGGVGTPAVSLYQFEWHDRIARVFGDWIECGFETHCESLRTKTVGRLAFNDRLDVLRNACNRYSRERSKSNNLAFLFIKGVTIQRMKQNAQSILTFLKNERSSMSNSKIPPSR